MGSVDSNYHDKKNEGPNQWIRRDKITSQRSTTPLFINNNRIIGECSVDEWLKLSDPQPGT